MLSSYNDKHCVIIIIIIIVVVVVVVVLLLLLCIIMRRFRRGKFAVDNGSRRGLILAADELRTV